MMIIHALSKKSSDILLLPLSVRPSDRKKSLSLELRLHFKYLRNDTLGYITWCVLLMRNKVLNFLFVPWGQIGVEQ